MLTIRFNRVGKRNRAQFRIVVQEHTVAPGGRHVEVLGSYDPHLKKGVFKSDKIKYWIEKGAQVSDSVYNLLVKQGIIKGKKRAVNIGKPKASEATAETPIKAAEEEKEKPAEPTKEEIKTEIKEENKKEEVKPEEKKEEAKELTANAAEEVKKEVKTE